MSVNSLPVYILAKLFSVVFLRFCMTCKIFVVNFYPLVDWLSGWQNEIYQNMANYGKIN